MRELVAAAKMVLVVTHSTSFIEKYCNRALWLDQGRIVADGEPVELVTRYKEFAAEKGVPKKRKILSLVKTEVQSGRKKTIAVNNLGICFRIGKKPFWALEKVNFSVREREIVGIIGPNGAGKTTLCRTICGLYRSDKGSIQVNGAVTGLLSFGTGFDRELSGLNNISLNGMMLGISKKDIRILQSEIIAFAELEKFIHKPVKYYSRGMRTRLGFSIATMLSPDILVIDEALSAGDVAFQEKAAARMQDMLADAKTVVIVSHSLSVVEKLCTRVIWMKNGTIYYDGDPVEAVSRYKKSIKKKKQKKSKAATKKKSKSDIVDVNAPNAQMVQTDKSEMK